MRRLLPQLAELTAETLWYCLEVIDRAPRVRSFRFEVPPYHGVGQPQPGQRLIVRATIGGVEVQRPYTRSVTDEVSGIKWPLFNRLQATTAYSALTGTALLVLLMLQWRLAYLRLRNGTAKSAGAYGLHIAIGPAVLGMIWLHSTHGCVSELSRKPRHWRGPGCLSKIAAVGEYTARDFGFAVAHGFTALWY
jgi:hypothetical protein